MGDRGLSLSYILKTVVGGQRMRAKEEEYLYEAEALTPSNAIHIQLSIMLLLR